MGEEDEDKEAATLELIEGEGVKDKVIVSVGEGQGVALSAGLSDTNAVPLLLLTPESEGLDVTLPEPEGHCTGEPEDDKVLEEHPEKEGKDEGVTLGEGDMEVVEHREEEKDPDAMGLMLTEDD